MSSKGVMQQLEITVDRQLLAGMVSPAVGVTMLTCSVEQVGTVEHGAIST